MLKTASGLEVTAVLKVLWHAHLGETRCVWKWKTACGAQRLSSLDLLETACGAERLSGLGLLVTACGARRLSGRSLA